MGITRYECSNKKARGNILRDNSPRTDQSTNSTRKRESQPARQPIRLQSIIVVSDSVADCRGEKEKRKDREENCENVSSKLFDNKWADGKGYSDRGADALKVLQSSYVRHWQGIPVSSSSRPISRFSSY